MSDSFEARARDRLIRTPSIAAPCVPRVPPFLRVDLNPPDQLVEGAYFGYPILTLRGLRQLVVLLLFVHFVRPIPFLCSFVLVVGENSAPTVRHSATPWSPCRRKIRCRRSYITTFVLPSIFRILVVNAASETGVDNPYDPITASSGCCYCCTSLNSPRFPIKSLFGGPMRQFKQLLMQEIPASAIMFISLDVRTHGRCPIRY